MKLTENFNLAEFTVSETAARHKLDNTPPSHILPILNMTARKMEEVRMALGNHPIIITSGYRSPTVNAAVGSRPTSAHIQGYAVDFICPKFGTPKQIVEKLIKSHVAYDQVIEEFPTAAGGGWVHISFAPQYRRMALTIDDKGTRAFA
jgi:zinc D-Ala-D-Ala carboxypeptidase